MWGISSSAPFIWFGIALAHVDVLVWSTSGMSYSQLSVADHCCSLPFISMVECGYTKYIVHRIGIRRHICATEVAAFR